MIQGRKQFNGLRPWCFWAWLLLLPLPVWAEAQGTVSETATVASNVDGDTLTLEDGRRVRIDGINALEIPHRAEDAERCLPSTRTQPSNDFAHDFGCDLTLAKAAKTLLHALTAGKKVRLLINPARREDRYGRLLAQVLVRDQAGQEVSVADVLLREGLAHVYPLSGQEIGTGHLLPLEEQARARKLGIWQLPELQVTQAEQAGTQYGHYALIEGRVVGTAKTKGKIFLNFGPDYHTDFSVMIDKRDWKNFSGIDLIGLKGKRVLVRGFLHEDYGPALRITNDGQIMVLN